MHQAGQLAQAAAVCEEILKSQPGHFDALHLRGVVAAQTKDFQRAIELIGKAIEINPGNANAYHNRGNALCALKQYDNALFNYDQAIALKPNLAEAHLSRGNILKDLAQSQAALASYDQAIALRPDYAEAYHYRGNILYELHQCQAALESYDKAIELSPDYAEACNNRGAVLQVLKQYQAALQSCDRAIALKPNYTAAYVNRGFVLHKLGQYQAALQNYDQAIALQPDHAIAHNNRGNILQDLKQFDAAIPSYARALAIKPDYEFLYGKWLHAKMHICDWRDVGNQLVQLTQKIQRGEKVVTPFALQALTGSLPLQRKVAEILVDAEYPPSLDLPTISKRARHTRIRIGYFSADFYSHPVSILLASLIESHDRNRFEAYAFSFGPNTGDEMRKRMENAFDQFLDVRNKSDRDIAELARKMEIDIAIDLGGQTKDSRAGIFAKRAAPIQAVWLGYGGTMGAKYIDYLIADPVLIPEESRQHYSENIAYLPCFMPSDEKRPVADRRFTREELGLPSKGFVFCCFNNSYKITPGTFDIWMRILKQVDGSVLWLTMMPDAAMHNLQQEAMHGGVNSDRLIFAKRMPLQQDHLARLRVADLLLDTLPYNAGTTASDALWVGLPVLTCKGEAFASRMASSLLNAIHLPELITATQEGYEVLAVELATNPERLKRIRQKLEQNRFTTPLFDSKLFTQNIEDAYTQMYERYLADLPPAHITSPLKSGQPPQF